MSGPRWMTCPECKGRKGGCGCLTCCGHGHVIDPASLPPARFDAPRKPPTKADLLDKIERRFKDGGASHLLWSDVQHLLAEARAAITERARVAKLEAALREIEGGDGQCGSHYGDGCDTRCKTFARAALATDATTDGEI